MKNVSWVKFVLLFFLLSCKTADSEDPKLTEEEVVPEIKATNFMEDIKAHTTLVKTIVRNEVQEVAPGLSYVEAEYLNSENEPMAMYILLADLTRGTSLAATAATNGENLNAKESVRKQITYVEDRGYDVLAAVNADFWRINANETDNTPMGQAYGAIYIDGKMIKDITRSSTYYFAGVKKDGSFIMGDKLTYLRAKPDLKEVLGARYLLVEKGKDVSGSIANKDLAPRTSVGEFGTHNVVFIVVDGRRADHSQGVSMQDLAKIYEAIGAKTALNLDGGGSSTLILKNQAGDLTLKNRPSDNAERSVANSWTIVKN